MEREHLAAYKEFLSSRTAWYARRNLTSQGPKSGGTNEKASIGEDEGVLVRREVSGETDKLWRDVPAGSDDSSEQDSTVRDSAPLAKRVDA